MLRSSTSGLSSSFEFVLEPLYKDENNFVSYDPISLFVYTDSCLCVFFKIILTYIIVNFNTWYLLIFNINAYFNDIYFWCFDVQQFVLNEVWHMFIARCHPCDTVPSLWSSCGALGDLYGRMSVDSYYDSYPNSPETCRIVNNWVHSRRP